MGFVYVHGQPGSPEELRLVRADGWSGAQDLLAPDRAGEGADLPLAAYLDHLARTILQRVPAGPIRLVGFSLGGVIALDIVRRLIGAAGDRDLSLDLIATPAPLGDADVLKQMAGGMVFSLARTRPSLFGLLTSLQGALSRWAPGLLYRQIFAAAAGADEKDLYQAQLDLFLNPNDPAVIAQARADGVSDAWLDAARNSPVWKMAMEWKIAFPLHPEYRTLPMVWYVPPLSPIQNAAAAGAVSMKNGMPDVSSLRIPLKYLANLLTAGDEAPVQLALERMLAMRAYMRAKSIEGRIDTAIATEVGLQGATIEDMYKYLALANYEDRFVIPTAHREWSEDTQAMRGGCGFTFGNGCAGGETTNLFATRTAGKAKTPMEVM